jgi:hypothetical protein
VPQAPPISSSSTDHSNNNCWSVQAMKPLIM